jgi:hypothetical protein
MQMAEAFLANGRSGDLCVIAFSSTALKTDLKKLLAHPYQLQRIQAPF